MRDAVFKSKIIDENRCERIITHGHVSKLINMILKLTSRPTTILAEAVPQSFHLESVRSFVIESTWQPNLSPRSHFRGRYLCACPCDFCIQNFLSHTPYLPPVCRLDVVLAWLNGTAAGLEICFASCQLSRIWYPSKGFCRLEALWRHCDFALWFEKIWVYQNFAFRFFPNCVSKFAWE